jgi:hypothetical protein
MRRKITTALISLAMLVLGTVAVAPAANASSQNFYCFVNADGTLYASLPVTVQVSRDYTNWYDVLSTATEANGCSSYTLSGDYMTMYSRAKAYTEVPTQDGMGGAMIYWLGYSQWTANPGEAAADLGTGTVVCYAWAIQC